MYYKFEERNSCPQCGGALSHVGSVSTNVVQIRDADYQGIRNRDGWLQ